MKSQKTFIRTELENDLELIAILGLMLVVAIPVMIFNEYRFIKQTLHAERLLIGALVIGVGGGLIVWWKKFRKAEDVEARYRSLVVCTLITALLFPGLALLTNRFLSPFSTVAVPAIYERENVNPRVHRSRYQTWRYNVTSTFFSYKGKTYHIENRYSPYSGAFRGDTIMVPLKRGLYGIYYFTNGIGERRRRNIENRALYWLNLENKRNRKARAG